MLSSMKEKEWKLEELAERAAVSPRTVRYYVQRGLLPSPVFRGRDTMYGEHHLLRLRAIRKLQERFLPLDAIEVELSRLGDVELESIVKGTRVPKSSLPSPRSTPEATPHAHASHASHAKVREWSRTTLAKGLELHLAHDAEPSARALAEALLALVERLRDVPSARKDKPNSP